MTWPRVSVCLLLLASPCAAFGQTPGTASSPRAEEAPAVRQSLDAIGALVPRIPNASLGVNFAEWRMRVALDTLKRLPTPPAEPALEYRTDLARDVQALEQALTLTSPEPLQALLEAIADDLEIKAEHGTKGGAGLGGTVALTVRTVQGTGEIRNEPVFYLPKVADLLGGAVPRRFPQSGTSTTERLTPGRYVMWVGDPNGGPAGERTLVKIGEGRTDASVDLPVPAGPLR